MIVSVELGTIAVGVSSLPALEGVHKLPRCLQVLPHQARLRAHDLQGILQKATLIFTGWRRRHCENMERFVVELWVGDV